MLKFKELVKKEVRELTPYDIEIIDARVKLDAMENPYPLTAELISMIQSEIKDIPINRYPDPYALKLRESIGSNIDINPDNILIGNGSDELIQIIFTSFGEPGDSILIPSPTFSMYRIIGAPLRLKIIEAPLTNTWDIDPNSFIKAIKENRPKIIVLANPNNPTGNCFKEEAIELIIENAAGVVVLDEAYYDFSKKTALSLMDRYPNLIVLRTLSKIGMAGLRVGFMVVNRELGAEISKVRLPYNSNSISQAVARIILENRQIIDSQIESIIEERCALYDRLSAIRGIKPYRSETNFILFRSDFDAEKIYNGLKEEGILVRCFFGDDGRLKNHLRVTVGTGEENAIFIEVLTRLLIRNYPEA